MPEDVRVDVARDYDAHADVEGLEARLHVYGLAHERLHGLEEDHEVLRKERRALILVEELERPQRVHLEVLGHPRATVLHQQPEEAGEPVQVDQDEQEQVKNLRNHFCRLVRLEIKDDPLQAGQATHFQYAKELQVLILTLEDAPRHQVDRNRGQDVNGER